ncbi:MAG: D-sedoheptulose 7-phosphate isomerase [bacterium]|nr:D-sedoheptulose 7-phosphate isomerase [bacterium]
MSKLIDNAFESHAALIAEVQRQMTGEIERAAEKLVASLNGGHKLLLCGNGGSAADAQHFAAEFTGRFLAERKPLPAIALTTDTSALTAIGNDYGFDTIFERQVRALAAPGDLLLAISTSGNSANVIAAMAAMKELGGESIALTGRDGGRMKALADLNLIVPSDETPRIQEMHVTIGHILCAAVDRHFVPESR